MLTQLVVQRANARSLRVHMDQASFDPKEFLAKVGEGKTISK
jgi:hypothetical protein